jgi:hypothetical protein
MTARPECRRQIKNSPMIAAAALKADARRLRQLLSYAR